MERKEALEVVRKNMPTDRSLPVYEALQTLIPELAENEDERIRKKLIEIIGYFRSRGIDQQLCEEFLAYLEKQKEQKPEDRFEEARKKYQVEWSKDDEAAYDAFMCEVVNEKMNPTIEQIKWLRGIRNRLKPLRPVKQEWSEEDEEMRNLIVAIFKVNHPDGFFKANEFGTTDMRGVHTEEIIAWLKSLRPQPKQEWSEEDEMIRNAILGFLNPDKGGTKYSSNAELVEWSNWLKSLRPSWKPSEEQMDSLRDTIVQTKWYSYSMYLPELYEQLKKLM